MSAATFAPSRRTPVARRAHRRWVLVTSMIVLAVIASFAGLCIGAIRVGPGDMLAALTGGGSPTAQQTLHYALPRVLLCWFVGIALAVAGGVMQGVVRNPLAAPDVIGVTKGAGLGAMFLLLVAPGAPVIVLPIAAFLGGLIAAVAVYVLAYRRGTTPVRLALVGIAVSAVCEAAIRFVLVRDPQNLNASLVWLTGSLFGRSMSAVYEIAPWVVVLVPLVLLCTRRLDVLALGDDLANGLGEPVERTRRLTLLLAVALASAAVAVSGTVGFVGLVAPHVARRLVGGRHMASLPVAALFGVLLMLIADTAGRGLAPPLEIPAGLVTAAVGTPYFLYLLARSAKR